MEEIKIPLKTSRVVILQIVSIVFAAIGVTMLIYISYNDLIIFSLSTLSFLMSFVGPVILIKKLNGIPALIINDEGLLSGNNKVLVKWNEINSFSFETFKYIESLVVNVHDYDALIARSQGIRKIIGLFNRNINSNKLSIIDIGTLQINKLHLENEINKRLKQ
ncbi:STM3941 family protein [Paenibacillus sp. UNC496MF]|uniref:STM3941 family protein n=1 Tax=Paenibacillus sp. UNC496MF TaxID=1502753 RepID=UPI0011606993|nr:STM3941 family protein [Paenibacillus sp. UNC496MF]